MGRYTQQSITKWDLFKGALDNYCTFKWNGLVSTDDTLRTFIVSDKKDGLSTYNGLNFSNTYSKPQFENGSGVLQGITFNTKQIKFKIGSYGLTLDEYANVMHWLDPYVIGNLTFNYDPNYGCHCKLAQLSDSEKYPIGYTSTGEVTYYFESNVTFDIIGENVKYDLKPYPWQLANDESVSRCVLSKTVEQSPLDIGFTIDMTVTLNKELLESNNGLNAKIQYVQIIPTEDSFVTKIENEEDLFNIVLNKNIFEEFDNSITLHISYDSNTGVLLYGDEKTNFSLLTLLSLYNGRKLVESINSDKLLLPGSFSKQLDYNNLRIEFNQLVEEAKVYMYAKKKII